MADQRVGDQDKTGLAERFESAGGAAQRKAGADAHRTEPICSVKAALEGHS